MISETNDDDNNPAENFVTCIHRAKLGGIIHDVNVTWAKTLMSHSLYITVVNPRAETHYTCKVDLKTWQFWGKKGLKTFKIDDDKRVDVFWDLRSAKFSNSPEPTAEYYVSIVSQGEMILLLGDQRNEAFKRTKCKPCLGDASWLAEKKEIVFAKKCFCTKTRLGQGEREHNIVIESALSGTSDPEMWIGVDGIELIRVTNLHWRFRGNDTIVVDDFSVQVMWDVHDWLYNCEQPRTVGIFIFRQGLDDLIEGGEFGSEEEEEEEVVDDECSPMGFCHFLYAWKSE